MISSVETLTTDTQSKALGTGIASESQHWYDKQGNPVYEVPMTTKAGMRPTKITDAVKLGLVPSWTLIGNCVAKPGLNAYWENMLLDSALTLPEIKGENADARKKRIREDAKEHSRKAREQGTDLHKAIEDYIRGNCNGQWEAHLHKIRDTLIQHGIDIFAGQSEHSFSASIDGNWYGGKTDFRKNREQDLQNVLIDFKSKEIIEPKKQLVWDEHAMQIAAYGYGLFGVVTTNRDWKWEAFRGLNVFVGVSDCEIRVHEHTPEDLAHGFELFRSILDFWTRKHYFGKYSKNGAK